MKALKVLKYSKELDKNKLLWLRSMKTHHFYCMHSLGNDMVSQLLNSWQEKKLSEGHFIQNKLFWIHLGSHHPYKENILKLQQHLMRPLSSKLRRLNYCCFQFLIFKGRLELMEVCLILFLILKKLLKRQDYCKQ